MAADLVIKNGWVVTPEEMFQGGVAISNEKIVAIGANDVLPQGKEEIDAKGKHILPGIIDGHVHFREPGMTHKEDFTTGSTAAVCGGITSVVDMPNTVPPTADAEQVKIKQQLGEAKSLVDFGVTGVVVQTNTKDILPMAGAGAIGFKIFFGETIGNLPFPGRRHVHGGVRLHRAIEAAVGNSCGKPSDHGVLHQQTKNRRKERRPLLGSFAPGYLRGRIRPSRDFLRRNVRHQAACIPYELQAGRIHGTRC